MAMVIVTHPGGQQLPVGRWTKANVDRMHRKYGPDSIDIRIIKGRCRFCKYINGHWKWCKRANEDPRWVKVGQVITEAQAARMIQG